jgi:hypothetical protein
MNERIHELAVQAEKLADEATNAYNDDTGNWQKVWNKIYDEKFAELIVAECAGIVQTYMSRWPEDAELTKQIKEHFGVK